MAAKRIGLRFQCRSDSCQKEIAVPESGDEVESTTEAIRVKCGCGWSRSVSAIHEGQRVRCKSCGSTITVKKEKTRIATDEESLEDDLLDALDEFESFEDAADLADAPTVSRRQKNSGTSRRRTKRQKAKPQSVRLYGLDRRIPAAAILAIYTVGLQLFSASWNEQVAASSVAMALGLAAFAYFSARCTLEFDSASKTATVIQSVFFLPLQKNQLDLTEYNQLGISEDLDFVGCFIHGLIAIPVALAIFVVRLSQGLHFAELLQPMDRTPSDDATKTGLFILVFTAMVIIAVAGPLVGLFRSDEAAQDRSMRYCLMLKGQNKKPVKLCRKTRKKAVRKTAKEMHRLTGLPIS